MAIKQIAVFVENHPGTLVEITDMLAAANIDLRALSISESQDFGILRMIVDDLEAAKAALTAGKCVFTVSDVVGVEIPDVPGSMAKIVRLLSDNDVNIEYVYAFNGSASGRAWVVIRVEDSEKAEVLLKKDGYRVFNDK